MRRPGVIALAALAALAVTLVAPAGCGGGAREQVREDVADFACRDRLVSYVVTGHISGDELGVQLDCAEAGPRLKRWRSDKQGNRVDDARSMSPAEFDRVWRDVDASGWPNLKDCENGTGGARDPVYVFDVKDDQNSASFQCQTAQVPFPYNTIVDPLDVAAQAGGKELGGSEP